MDGGEGSVVGGRYTLLRLLGRGGMAEVWLATDRRLGDKHVAVKRLLGYRADSPDAARDVERARREALAASRLNHGNLVAVTDFVAEDGEPFIVMEYVEGTTLSELVDGDGLPVPRAARIIAQVAAAMTEAHEAGIIHRDVKPANILVTRRDVAKLADFGIARSVGDVRLTQTGFFTGTVGYLAPELLDGSDATSASDVWALGAVLYEAVEGRPAFQGDTTATLIAAIVLRDLPVPQRAPELAPLIARMLERDPTRRIPIAEVAEELGAVGARAARPRETGLPAAPPAPETVRLNASLAPSPAGPGGLPRGAPGTPQPGRPPSPPRQDLPPPSPPAAARPRHRWWIAAAAVLVLIAAGVVAVVASSGDDPPTAGGGSPAASTPAAQTSTGVAAPVPASSPGSTATPAPGPFRVLAHRGGRENYAEESLPALVQAGKDGYGIETDIRWTADDVAVIVHDATTAGNLTCTGGPYRVSTTRWSVLQQRCHTPAAASPDGRTYPIATLDQVAAGLDPVTGATLFAEVKVTQTSSQVSAFLAILARHHIIDRTVITSFYPAELVKMGTAARPLGTTVQLLRFVADAKTPAATLGAEGLTYVAVPGAAVSKSYLAKLRAAGLKSVAWTLDTEAQWTAARAAGADYVLTDVPKAYLAWLASR